jgi:PEP-CTERM motif
MNRSLLLAATVSVALTLTASAEAKVYDWSYTLTDGQGSGSGTFDADATLPALITDATGIISSDPGFGVGPFTVTGISGYAGADSTIYALGFDDNQVSLGGISLATGAGDINIFYLDGAPGVTNSVQNPGGGLVALYTADLSVTAVPEPSTWAMTLLGFAGLSFAGYRRARTAAQRSSKPPRADGAR